MRHSDASTFELSETRLRLKDGLRFSVRQGGEGRPWYLLEDEVSRSFYRVGFAEYTFLSLLDGQTTLASALATTCSVCGDEALSELQAIQFCRWLVDAGLAHTRASRSGKRMTSREATATEKLAREWLNPISVRIPLWNVDPVITSVTRYLRWMISWPAAIVYLLLGITAAMCILMDWDRLAEAPPILSRGNLIGFVAAWILTKGCHELAHAVACKRLGGYVGRSGILLLMFVPLPYVDVTAAWKFPRKSDRILVSSAGMLAELVLASVAAIVWYFAGPGFVSQQAANVVVAASLHTLLFNANPLMRFDGYHILADAVEIPNLGQHGQQFVSSWCRTHLLGLPASRVAYACWRGGLVKAYGVAALIWKGLICVTLCLSAANLWHGVGLVMAIVACVAWFGRPIVSFAKYLWRGSPFEQPDRRRFAICLGGILALIVTFGFALPAPSLIRAPLVIDYEPLHVVRAETPGFVDRVHVRPDQKVRKGELLVTMRNDELGARYEEVTAELKQADLRAATYQTGGEIAAWQSEMANVTALSQQLDEYRESLSRLKVLAPTDGIVIADDVASFEGVYFEAGQELLSVGDPDRKHAVSLIAQDDAGSLSDFVGDKVEIRVWGHGPKSSGVIEEINPRARLELPHPAFAAAHGGPLAVVEAVGQSEVGDAEATNLQLIEPRVRLDVRVDEDKARHVRAGETGQLRLRRRDERLGPYLARRLSRWLRSRVSVTHGL